MKFTDGQWVYKKNMSHLVPAELYSYDCSDNEVTLYAPFNAVNDRADTLDQGMLTVSIRSPLENVLTIKITHHAGALNRGPFFPIADTSQTLKIKNCDNKLIINSGKLSAAVDTFGGYGLEFLFADQRITGTRKKGTAYITNLLDGKNYLKEQLSLGVGECVYGLGERFTSFVKNGQVVDCWNDDGGTSSEISYKNIPFYLTNKGYGVLVHHPEHVSFEVASEQVEAVQFSVEGEYLEYSIIAGETLKDVLSQYTALTGRPPVPPAWSYGLWLSTSFTTNYDETTVTSFLDKMEEYHIPLSVFHFDCFWMKAFQWCDFQWDPEMFPDPKAMLTRLKRRNLKICVWINPYIAQKSPLFQEGVKGGYFLKRPDGSVWQWDRWQAGMALVDFTNPSAVNWYQDKLKALVDMGVDCFKTDFGERIPTNVVYYDGSDPQKMHNYYTYLYNQAVESILHNSTGESVLFARSATVGGQKFPVHWGGDCWGTYESMAESLRGGLSLCLSGFGYWSHDIGGFETTSTADLYKRWAAFGLLSTHSRLHGSHTYRVPWNYDEEACEVVRFFTQTKCRLMPYLYGQSQKTAKVGIPVMRAMVLEYPQDRICKYLDLQYMLGDNILVAPVFNSESLADYYLLEGIWTDLITGKEYNGGQFIQEKVGYFQIPALVRENSIIPLGAVNDRPDYDYSSGTTLAVYRLGDGQEASCELYNEHNVKRAQICIQRHGSTYGIQVTGSTQDLHVMFVNSSAESVKEKTSHKEDANLVVSLGNMDNQEIQLTLV